MLGYVLEKAVRGIVKCIWAIVAGVYTLIIMLYVAEFVTGMFDPFLSKGFMLDRINVQRFLNGGTHVSDYSSSKSSITSLDDELAKSIE